jgi:hypothetical protein
MGTTENIIHKFQSAYIDWYNGIVDSPCDHPDYVLGDALRWEDAPFYPLAEKDLGDENIAQILHSKKRGLVEILIYVGPRINAGLFNGKFEVNKLATSSTGNGKITGLIWIIHQLKDVIKWADSMNCIVICAPTDNKRKSAYRCLTKLGLSWNEDLQAYTNSGNCI